MRAVLHAAGYCDSFGAIPRPAVLPNVLPPPTCWTNTRLDYVFLSQVAAAGAVRVTAHTTVRDCDVSDHFPVLCEIVISRYRPGIHSPSSATDAELSELSELHAELSEVAKVKDLEAKKLEE